MKKIIVFDVNETLLDVQNLKPHFKRVFGDAGILREWFSLLLLHSEVVTLAGPYFDFSTLASAALDATAASKATAISKQDKEQILQGMLRLPAHPDVRPALDTLRKAGIRLVTLTNSSQTAAEEQLKSAGISDFFDRTFSVDSVRRYKPAPETYQMVAAELGVRLNDLRLVAAHGWDIIGALQAGCAAAFVSRPGKVLFPAGPRPDITGPDLESVAAQILEQD